MRNPRSRNLDKFSFTQGVELMFSEEAEGIVALRREAKKVARAAQFAFEALNSGGRVFYIGAGTSGRLGILDASECPPTFRASPEIIQGIIAGGARAIWQAVEGAEDDAKAGGNAIAFRGITSRDLVVGIAASGRTPFVWGAFTEAKNRGARTVLISFNPALKIDPGHGPDLVIAPRIGPEVLTGSTRLKSGTATKLILNAISTLAMVKLGKVASNLMIDLNPSNVKLRDRAIRIIHELTGVDATSARHALETQGWVIKDALVFLKGARPKMAKTARNR
jgi:N-acetylmuramic acid 6-phosphate etherase